MKDNLTMKTLPESEQPYYICERYGAKMLTDAQLLAVIIKTGTRELRVTQVAENLIKELGDKKLAGLMFMSSKEMQRQSMDQVFFRVLPKSLGQKLVEGIVDQI